MRDAFGKYELLRRIGVGGMAEVFAAKTFGPEGFVKEVVIKRILPAFSEDPDFVSMFINEARVAAKLQHANIVQIFDFNHVDGVYYIAMEWVDGTDLKRVLNQARSRSMPTTLAMAVHVGVEVLKGLHYAHSRTERGEPLNLVHRDISPHNLLLSLSGEVKIADFGIAKVAALASATRSGMLKGKLAYMSPEQASNEVLDGRSDIFSLGIVLWELLAGRRLYQADSEAEIFAQVKRAAVPRVRSVNTDVPEALDAVLARMLAPTAADRYTTAAEALAELSRFGGASAALEVADYLRRLLPAVACRDRRGETARLSPSEAPEQIPVAASDEPTHTRDAGGPVAAGGPRTLASGQDPAPASGEEPAPASGEEPAPASGEEPEMGAGCAAQAVSPAHGVKRWTVAAAVIVFVVAAVLVWVAARSPGVPTKDDASGPSGPAVRLEVAAAHSAAELFVDGVPVGRGPRMVMGEKGTRLHLEARTPRGRRARIVRLDEDHRVVLATGSAASDASARGAVTVDAGAGHRRGPASTGGGAAAFPDRGKRPEDPPRARVAKRDRRSTGGRKGPELVRAQTFGTLDVLVSPWARVKIDGREVGPTPLIGHSLTTGSHRVELYNPELNRSERLKVTILEDRSTRVRKNWD